MAQVHRFQLSRAIAAASFYCANNVENDVTMESETAMASSLFDHAFIINLPHRADRRREMEQELNKTDWRLDGPDMTLFAAERPDDAGGFPSIGAHGCFLSHLAVLKAGLALGVERVAIIEDDVSFARDFKTKAARVASALEQTQWDIFYGGFEALTVSADPNAPFSSIAPTDWFQTSHFIVFRKRAISAAISYLEQLQNAEPGSESGGPMHVDGAYNWFRRAHPHLTCKLAVPKLATQRASRSDIAAGAWYDTMPVVRDAATLARRLFKQR